MAPRAACCGIDPMMRCRACGSCNGQLDRTVHLNHSLVVPSLSPERPYFETWLRRTRKQFASSGRLSQVAAVLALESGEPSDTWRQRLRDLLDGGGTPSLDLLMRIDLILAKPSKCSMDEGLQGSLF